METGAVFYFEPKEAQFLPLTQFSSLDSQEVLHHFDTEQLI
jgi:hypothetical protein